MLSVAVGLRAAFVALNDPKRHEMVAALGEVTAVTLPFLRSRMLKHPTGRRILRERPLITDKSLEAAGLHTLAPSTFGGAYYQFMRSNNFNADSRAPIKYIKDPELAYIMLRHRQTHDFSHVLTGLTRVSVENEILLKWFEFSQTGLPVSLLSGLSGPLKFRRSLHGESAKGEELSKIALSIQSGARCDFLLNVMYEDEFATDLDALRAKLGIQLII